MLPGAERENVAVSRERLQHRKRTAHGSSSQLAASAIRAEKHGVAKLAPWLILPHSPLFGALNFDLLKFFVCSL